jgi:hypothetical protein
VALHFDLMVNDRPIGIELVIQRLEPLGDGHVQPGQGTGRVYTYEAYVYDEPERRVQFKHDYDDGALWCARRALDALLGEEKQW